MLTNHESIQFIQETLEISDADIDQLARFVAAIQQEPEYMLHSGPLREFAFGNLGVEFTQSGELVLKYFNQSNQTLGFEGSEQAAWFTPTDVDLMRSIAYGPLLK